MCYPNDIQFEDLTERSSVAFSYHMVNGKAAYLRLETINAAGRS